MEAGGGHGGGFSSNPVLGGAGGVAVHFMKVSAVCCCGELNLLCVVPLQQCRGAHQGNGAPSEHPHAAGTCCLGILPGLLRAELRVAGEPLPAAEPRSSGTSACVHALPHPFQAADFPSIVPLC